jgi:hypothetical protein
MDRSSIPEVDPEIGVIAIVKIVNGDNTKWDLMGFENKDPLVTIKKKK